MSPLEVFQRYYVQLVQLLPMKNDIFIARLYANNLLPGELKEDIDSSFHTSTKKAAKFLDDVIKPTVRHDDSTRFNVLLTVMKSCDDKTVNNLAETISLALNQSLITHTGKALTRSNLCIISSVDNYSIYNRNKIGRHYSLYWTTGLKFFSLFGQVIMFLNDIKSP